MSSLSGKGLIGNQMLGRVLIIAGSDSGGGAGIQADIKAVSALDGFAATALTAVTAQNTRGVFGVLPIPPDFIEKQIEVVLSDIGADCIKTGMLHDADVIHQVVKTVKEHAPGIPLVVDPVMVAKGGSRLLLEDAVTALIKNLIPIATLLTPNIPEAEALTGIVASDEQAIEAMGKDLLSKGAQAVLVKGGHLNETVIVDWLFSESGIRTFKNRRIDTPHTHGTGCTLASSIAAGLAGGLELEAAIEQAEIYLHKAILGAPGFGSGHGPIDHMHPVRR